MERTAGLLMVLTALATPTSAANSDAGYEKIWTMSSTENVKETCFELDKSLHWMNGSYIVASVAQFEIGEQTFQGSLDGYGKWHRFEFSADQGMCFQCRMMESGFYNQSMQENKIIPEMLFADTTPSANTTTMQRALAPNDNNLVNSFQIGNKFRVNTDFIYYLEMDPYNLEVLDLFKYTDGDVVGFPLGSAHPMTRVDGTSSVGCLVNIESYQKIAGARGGVLIYETCADKPDERRELNRYDSSYSPYVHSWGMTNTYAIIPHQTCYADTKLMFKENIYLVDAFRESEEASVTIMLAPLDGSEPIAFQVEAPFYYTHVVNSFDIEDGVVFDVVSFNRCAFNGGVIMRDYATNPDRRNSGDYMGTIKRFVLYITGKRKGQYEVTALSQSNVYTDFTRINDKFQSKPYCHFYGTENFHGTSDLYGSMAIVKQSLCTPGGAEASVEVDVQPPVYWQKENYFPGEPLFIPNKSVLSHAEDDDDDDDEDDGVLMFTAVEGESFKAFIVVVNAKTMETIQEIELPTALTFTLHGQFYPGLVDRT